MEKDTVVARKIRHNEKYVLLTIVKVLAMIWDIIKIKGYFPLDSALFMPRSIPKIIF